MAVSLVTLAEEVETDAAAIATEIGGGRTTAQIQALAEFLRVAGRQPGHSQCLTTLMPLADQAQLQVGN